MISAGSKELLQDFEKRMRFVNLIKYWLQRSKPTEIREILHNNDDKTEPEWGVKSFNLNKQTGNFNITVTAGKERYPDTKIYVALYRNGVLVSVKSFVPEFDSNSEYSGDGTMSLLSDMTNISAKAFIWHGEMVPITEAIQLSIK